MRLTAFVIFMLAPCFCVAQDASDFKPASSNVLDAQYPRVDSNSRVEIRFKAPDAGTRASRLALCDVTARVLALGLRLLGITAPDQM